MDWLRLPVFLSGALKRGVSGHLLHNADGHLVNACAPIECPCLDPGDPCEFCPGDTVSQFHVTFHGVTLCTECLGCGIGIAVKMAGPALDGTYLMAKNGPCTWTTFSTDVPTIADEYLTDDCASLWATVLFAINQTRIDAGHFRLQVTDFGNRILLFDATVARSACCDGYTVSNGLTSCGCFGTSPVRIAAATGGTATVTPC